MDRHLDRRQFARAASSGLALFAIPGWFAACARTERSPVQPSERPVLVLRVHDDVSLRRQLGESFGLYLIHGTDEQLAWLATCDLACATTDELESHGLDLTGVHALLLCPGAAPRVVLCGEFPSVRLEGEAQEARAPTPMWGSPEENQLLRSRAEADYAWIAEQLVEALGPGSSAFEWGCARDRRAAGELPTGATPTFTRALETPFLALEQAARSSARRAAWNAELASVVHERWRSTAPQGSSWSSYSGCGIEFENLPAASEALAVACGMGHVPEYSRRFLYLFNADERAGKFEW